MWLQGFSRKWNVVTRRADTRCSCHASHACVIYDTVRGYTSALLSFIWGGCPLSIQPPMFPPRLRPRNKQHFKTKTIWYLQTLAPCEVFFINSTLKSLIAYLQFKISAVIQGRLWKKTKGLTVDQFSVVFHERNLI